MEGPFNLSREPKMSKKRNRSARRIQQDNGATKNHFELRKISPLTPTQDKVFKSYGQDSCLILHGYAGTGKTFISLYLSLDEVLNTRSHYEKIIIIRSAVPSRDVGFLPGSLKEKIRAYEEPYKEICDDLFGRGDGYDLLKMRGVVNFTSTSYLRGLTFNNAIVIVDEIQNMQWGELDTVMTRLGDNSKIIFCGDYRQTDLDSKDRSGLLKFMGVIKNISGFDYIEFDKSDIVRGGKVRDYIIHKTEMGY